MSPNIIPFPTPEDIAPEDMTREQLTAYLESLREQIRTLDAKEPRNMESEAYEDWAEAHEELEDLVDEALDLLDAMQ